MIQQMDIFSGKFIDKVANGIELLREYEPADGYFMGFSGGKDSLALKILAKMAGVKFTPVYNITTVDPPELIYYIRQHHPETDCRSGPFSMWDLILKKRMPPTRTARYCCAYLKEGSSGGKVLLTGVRWAESRGRRAKRREVETEFSAHIANELKPRLGINPLITWTDLEVWGLINQHNAPYCSLYDEGFNRLGCVLCPLASDAHRQLEEKRWPKIAAMYRWTFNKLFESWGGHFTLSRTWTSGDAIYEWYMGRLRLTPEQQYYLDLFEMDNFGDEAEGIFES